MLHLTIVFVMDNSIVYYYILQEHNIYVMNIIYAILYLRWCGSVYQSILTITEPKQ